MSVTSRQAMIGWAQAHCRSEQSLESRSILRPRMTIERAFLEATFDNKKMGRLSAEEVADAVCDTAPYSSGKVFRLVDIVTSSRDGAVWDNIERMVLAEEHPERVGLSRQLKETYGNDACTIQMIEEYHRYRFRTTSVGAFEEVSCAIKIMLLDNSKLTEVGMSTRLELMAALLGNLESTLVHGIPEWLKFPTKGSSRSFKVSKRLEMLR